MCDDWCCLCESVPCVTQGNRVDEGTNVRVCKMALEAELETVLP